MERCAECPSKDSLSELLIASSPILEEAEYIEYKKWVSVEKSSLVTVRADTSDFLNELIDLIEDLTKHHFTAHAQSQYLKDLKASLQPGKIIVLMDFAENYSFVVQDAAQAFHWDNRQATLHPMVVYYKRNESASLECLSFCVISDYMQHSTSAVHLFITMLLEELVKEMAIEHVHYYSDGAASQYKNKLATNK